MVFARFVQLGRTLSGQVVDYVLSINLALLTSFTAIFPVYSQKILIKTTEQSLG